MFNSVCLIVENLWICNLRIVSPTKFADWQFADLQFVDQWKEICGLAHLRNLRICDCVSLRIFGFKKPVVWPPLQIYSGAWGKLIHEKNLKSKILWHYPFKLSFACTKLYQVKAADSRFLSLPTGNYNAWLNLLKGPPPPTHTHTHKWRKYILEWRGWISRAIPRKCSPLAQIRRKKKKPGPLLLVYFMIPGLCRDTCGKDQESIIMGWTVVYFRSVNNFWHSLLLITSVTNYNAIFYFTPRPHPYQEGWFAVPCLLVFE